MQLAYRQQTSSLIENSTETGILLGGNDRDTRNSSIKQFIDTNKKSATTTWKTKESTWRHTR